MIIFPNAVYIHVPKTAGSSFELMCEERHGYLRARDWIDQDLHSTARDIPNSERHKWIFGFIRNPAHSEFSNFRYHHHAWELSPDVTFDDWCEWRYTDKTKEYGMERLGIPMKYLEYGYTFNIRPQAGYFCDENGNSIADAIFRYSDFYPALNEISRKLGLDCDLRGYNDMQYSWSRGNQKYEESITPHAVSILREVKGVDFMLYDTPGRVITNFIVPTVPNYAYAR